MTPTTTPTTTRAAARRARSNAPARPATPQPATPALPQVVVPQGVLSEALGRMAAITPQKPAMPVLGNVLLIADEAGLRLAATNLAVGVIEAIPGLPVQGAAGLTVPARLLADLIKTLEGAITLRFDGEHEALLVEAPGFHTTIRGIAAEEFPQIPSLGDRALATIAGGLLREAVRAVAGAAEPTLDAGNQFANVRLWLRGAELVADAADGALIARHVVPLESPSVADTEILIPATFLRSLAGLLDGAVEILANANLVGFRTATCTVIAQQSATAFPAVERVIRALPAPDLTAEGEAEALLRGLRRALMLAPANQSHITTLTITDTGAQPALKLHAQSSSGDHSGEVALSKTAGHGELQINGAILADVIKALGSPTVIIERSSSYPGLRLRRPDRPGSCQIVALLAIR